MQHTNILLAGATGYLGRHLLKVLIEKQNYEYKNVATKD